MTENVFWSENGDDAVDVAEGRVGDGGRRQGARKRTRALDAPSNVPPSAAQISLFPKETYAFGV